MNITQFANAMIHIFDTNTRELRLYTSCPKRELVGIITPTEYGVQLSPGNPEVQIESVPTTDFSKAQIHFTQPTH